MMSVTYSILSTVIILTLGILGVLNFPVFGRAPKGERLARLQKLTNFKDGVISNLSPTPMKPDNVSYWDMLSGMIKGNENGRPKNVLPHIVPDFSETTKTKLIWFGHSSYYLQIDGVKILVDPVFSKRPSPFSFIGTRNFAGTGFVKVEDMPDLDIVLITHDHYDHMDYQTILKLVDKTRLFITSLGAGEHLEYWGVPAHKIKELAWGEAVTTNGLKFVAAPARHFTGRGFKRNQTLWSAFILQASQHKLYLGGDSGYDSHFKETGAQYGPFDLAILECGQYNVYWPFIHMFPEQTVQAAKDLNAKVLLPVHWGKFALAMHNWDDSIIRVAKKAKEENLKLTTPVMGEPLILDSYYPDKEWWLN